MEWKMFSEEKPEEGQMVVICFEHVSYVDGEKVGAEIGKPCIAVYRNVVGAVKSVTKIENTMVESSPHCWIGLPEIPE